MSPNNEKYTRKFPMPNNKSVKFISHFHVGERESGEMALLLYMSTLMVFQTLEGRCLTLCHPKRSLKKYRKPWLEVGSVVLTLSIAPPFVLRLASTPASMEQLLHHGTSQGSWRNRCAKVPWNRSRETTSRNYRREHGRTMEKSWKLFQPRSVAGNFC